MKENFKKAVDFAKKHEVEICTIVYGMTMAACGYAVGSCVSEHAMKILRYGVGSGADIAIAYAKNHGIEETIKYFNLNV